MSWLEWLKDWLKQFERNATLTAEERIRRSIQRDNTRTFDPARNPQIYYKRAERNWMRENTKNE